MLDDHNYELRFLNLNDYNNEKALEEMIQNDKWMRESALARFEDPGWTMDVAVKGALYGYRRDKNMNPIIYINARRALDNGFGSDGIFNCVDFLMTYTRFAAFVPGKIEQYQMIIDVNGVKMWEIPYNAIFRIVMHSSLNFKHLCRSLNMIGLNWVTE